MPKILIVIVVLIGLSAVITSASSGPDRVGSCCSISLDRVVAVAELDAAKSWTRLEDEVFDRIEQSSRLGNVKRPVFYRREGERLILEVAGLSCEAAKEYVSQKILDGFHISLTMGTSALLLDVISVSEMSLGPSGDLQVSLTADGREQLRVMTLHHIGEEAAVTVAGIGEVQRISILREIESGLISLTGDSLPKALVEDQRLALPLVVGECTPECAAGYAWVEGEKHYVYRPR